MHRGGGARGGGSQDLRGCVCYCCIGCSCKAPQDARLTVVPAVDAALLRFRTCVVSCSRTRPSCRLSETSARYDLPPTPVCGWLRRFPRAVPRWGTQRAFAMMPIGSCHPSQCANRSCTCNSLSATPTGPRRRRRAPGVFTAKPPGQQRTRRRCAGAVELQFGLSKRLGNEWTNGP